MYVTTIYLVFVIYLGFFCCCCFCFPAARYNYKEGEECCKLTSSSPQCGYSCRVLAFSKEGRRRYMYLTLLLEDCMPWVANSVSNGRSSVQRQVVCA